MDLGALLADNMRETLPDYLASDELGGALERMAATAQFDDVGRVTFSAQAVAEFETVTRARLGGPLAEKALGPLAGFTTREARQSQWDASGKLSVGAEFGLRDLRTERQLVNHNLYWVSQNGQRQVYSEIASTVRDGLGRGYGTKEIAAMLKDAMPQLVGKVEDNRWHVISSAALNRSRNFATVTTLVRTGIEMLVFAAAMDERTCQICGELDGQSISTRQAYRTVERVNDAATPEQAIDSAPWIGVNAEGMYLNTTGGKVPVSGAREAIERGAGLPPVHGNCRCEVWADFEEVEETTTEQAAMSGAVDSEARSPAAGSFPGTVPEALTARGQEAPSYVQNLTQQKVMEVLGVSQGMNARILATKPLFSAVEGAGVVGESTWVERSTGKTVARALAAFSDKSAAFTLAQVKHVPQVAVGRFVNQATTLSAERKLASYTLRVSPVRVTKGLFVPFANMTFDSATAAEFETFLATSLPRNAVARLGRSATMPMRKWLNVTVNGEHVLTKFASTGRALTFVGGA